jgi:hypothetical protein
MRLHLEPYLISVVVVVVVVVVSRLAVKKTLA